MYLWRNLKPGALLAVLGPLRSGLASRPAKPAEQEKAACQDPEPAPPQARRPEKPQR